MIESDNKVELKFEKEIVHKKSRQVLVEYKNGEKELGWKRAYKNSRPSTILMEDISFKSSQNYVKVLRSNEDIIKKIKHLHGIGGFGYHSYDRVIFDKLYQFNSFDDDLSVEKFDIFIYPNTEDSFRYIVEEECGLFVDREDNLAPSYYYFEFGSFPEIFMYVFVDNDYFEEICNDVKNSPKSVIDLQINLSDISELFEFHKNYKSNDEKHFNLGTKKLFHEYDLSSIIQEEEGGVEDKVIQDNKYIHPLKSINFSSNELVIVESIRASYRQPDISDIEEKDKTIILLINKANKLLFSIIIILVVLVLVVFF